MGYKKFFLVLGVIPSLASAHCPLCTAAVGSAAVMANYYGFPPYLLGIFVGAFGFLTGLWMSKLIKKFVHFPFQDFVIGVASFLLTVFPLMYLFTEVFAFKVGLFGDAGSTFNRVYVFNGFLIGGIIGLITSVIALFVHKKVKEAFGKVLFPFQSIAFIIVLLGLANLFMYLAIG